MEREFWLISSDRGCGRVRIHLDEHQNLEVHTANSPAWSRKTRRDHGWSRWKKVCSINSISAVRFI